MLSQILLDVIQILYLLLFNDVPDCSIKHVQVSENFTITEHLGNCEVSDSYMGFVAAKWNRSHQFVLCIWVLQKFISIFHTHILGESRFDLGFDLRII